MEFSFVVVLILQLLAACQSRPCGKKRYRCGYHTAIWVKALYVIVQLLPRPITLMFAEAVYTVAGSYR